MSWQDLVLTASSVFFIVALLPSVLSDEKPAISTSVTTGTALIGVAVVSASLDLWFNFVAISFTITLWYTQAIQQYRHRNAASTE